MNTNIVAAKSPNGNTVYGKFVGLFEIAYDNTGYYYPGWVPDVECDIYDAMETITGEIFCVSFRDGMYYASTPETTASFYKYPGPVAKINLTREHRKKRGRHSESNNRKANRQRIEDAMPLPF